jgi:HlyD family secretion protein
MKTFQMTVSFLMRHKISIIIVTLILLGAAYYSYVNYWSSENASTVSVTQTSTAKIGDIHVSVTGSGQVYAKEQVDLQSPAAGDAIEVKSVAVKNDQEVKKGDLIAVLDTRDAEKSIRDAVLSLRSAEIKMTQTKKLYDAQTEDDKLQRQAQEISLAQARNKLADAREELEDYHIRSPFDGVVTGLSVAAGDSVSRSDTVASVITKELYARVLLNEVDAAGVKVGNSVTLSFDALGAEGVSGTVTKIDTIGTVSQNVVSYNTEISFDSPGEKLKPGMSVDVEILVEGKDDILIVPASAVKSDSQGKYVLFGSDAAQSESKKVRVETGISDDTMVEIVSGLKEGDRILLGQSASSSSGSGTSSGTGNRNGSGPGGGMMFPF